MHTKHTQVNIHLIIIIIKKAEYYEASTETATVQKMHSYVQENKLL